MNEIKTGAQIKASTANSKTTRETMQSLMDKGVEYCMPLYVDVHGIPKTKTVPVSHFDRMLRGSELFTGAALDGLGQGPHDDELAVVPDPDAVMQLPWRPQVAVIPGQLTYHEQPYPMCSRTVLARQVDRAAKLGLKFNLGIECETYIVRRDPTAHNGFAPNDSRDTIAKAAYDATLTLLNLDFLNEIVSSMNKLGWEVHSFDHEDANGQFEFDFAYADVLTMADRFVVWRMMMKELARKYGWESTMMPKPYADRTGSGAHFNMSLADVKTGDNISGRRHGQARLRPFQACLSVSWWIEEARRGTRCRELPNRQFLQAPDQDGLDDGLYLGADFHLLWRQQSHAYVSRPDATAACRRQREWAGPRVSLQRKVGVPGR